MNMPGTKTVVVAEDELFIRIVAADVLAESGFDVLEAENALEVLDLLGQHEVTVLFTDIHMPGSMDGLRLAEIVAVRYPLVRLIITSGRQRLSVAEMPGGGVYLPKPYCPDRLASFVWQEASKYGLGG